MFTDILKFLPHSDVDNSRDSDLLTPVIILADNRLVWILLETVCIISTARFTLLGTNVTPLTVIIEIIADLDNIEAQLCRDPDRIVLGL